MINSLFLLQSTTSFILILGTNLNYIKCNLFGKSESRIIIDYPFFPDSLFFNFDKRNVKYLHLETSQDVINFLS